MYIYIKPLKFDQLGMGSIHTFTQAHAHTLTSLPATYPPPKKKEKKKKKSCTDRQTHTQKCHLLSWKETTFSCISRTLTSFFWRCSSFWKASLLAFFSARLSWKTDRHITHLQIYRHMCASSYTVGNTVTTDTWQQLFLLVILTRIPFLCADCIIPYMQFGTPWLGRSTAATSVATPSPTHMFDVSLFKTFFCLLWCATENIWNIFCQGVWQHCYTSIQAAYAHFLFSSSEKVLAQHEETGFKHDIIPILWACRERMAKDVACLQGWEGVKPALETVIKQIWNRMRPRALVQNQPTRELISIRKTSHKHKDLSHPR